LDHSVEALDQGLLALVGIAGHFRISADPYQLAHNLGLGRRPAVGSDIVRAAQRLGLKARLLTDQPLDRLQSAPLPCIVGLRGHKYRIVVARTREGQFRIYDMLNRTHVDETVEGVAEQWAGELILVTRRAFGAGINPSTFGFRWFVPSLLRYREALVHVLVSSLFLQLFALVTPLLFQIVIDKVLVHKGMSTLSFIVFGLLAIGLFDATLQYLRNYVISHTSSRIDVELGARLFDHLLRLPLAYYETRPTGQTVARVRELETIRSFLTGQGLSSALDLLFTLIFVAVLFYYSPILTMIVVGSIPFYILVTTLTLPVLREKINEKFNRGADTQQFLVESVVGIQTLKSAAVEPFLRAQWEEKLAAYVKVAFDAVMVGTVGQSCIQYINKATTALLLFFGAQAVIAGDMTVGALIAFNMIANQVSLPILRLSQLWQDFQQVRVSVDRLGDILNSPAESQPLTATHLPPAKGHIEVRDVTFRYSGSGPEILQGVSLDIPSGQTIGIVGPSGSGKSTFTRLLQRLYVVERGQILIDGIDIGQVDPAWLRRQIGVVLQENILFNRSIHDNIALAAPGMHRAQVIAIAKLAGADEFINKLPLGYDTNIEERGANLSGGQRQRIAIARALATNPRILIFDEATSALDYESEQIIQRNMQQIGQGRTVIIIAHRLAAVRHANRIIAIQDGRITEDGSHAELVNRVGSVYGKLWRLQLDGTAK
jgi:subfamily B ATP-binding cassette protein HlyB/CyaB